MELEENQMRQSSANPLSQAEQDIGPGRMTESRQAERRSYQNKIEELEAAVAQLRNAEMNAPVEPTRGATPSDVRQERDKLLLENRRLQQ